ncbi:interferon-induced protein 44-like isoform X2 [Gadus chalcogrammus]|uniref:interferon-induced protein 44-like isoform X2 n=1 Tax=Gadus chalcogrammus TaxID=1042646 RepID=UPI0024C3B937|nr:interferon-induced protein 44-like isoform X2 [Gadus chalcogrammus]
MGAVISFFYPPAPAPAPKPDLIPAWRTLDWGKKKDELQWLESFRPQSDNVKHLRVLLCGPAGSGKSSFINSVDSICQNRITGPADANNALEADPELAKIAGQSFTRKYKTHRIQKGTPGQYYPFVFNDVMGLEPTNGILLGDLTLAMKGRVKDNYKFDPKTPLDDSNDCYINNPTSNDKAHILVFVLAVDFNQVADEQMFKKITEIRLAARDLDIPQIAILTKIDEKSCDLVKKDLKNVYSSTNIKNAMEGLSNTVGFPLRCIFPLKNYHGEIELNDEMDMLILTALRQILSFANDRVNATDVAAADQTANTVNIT